MVVLPPPEGPTRAILSPGLTVMLMSSSTGCLLYTSVDKARSREVGGTGLGLAIAKNVIQMHHGIIDVESTVGEGTTFSVRIPLNYVPRQEAKP